MVQADLMHLVFIMNSRRSPNGSSFVLLCFLPTVQSCRNLSPLHWQYYIRSCSYYTTVKKTLVVGPWRYRIVIFVVVKTRYFCIAKILLSACSVNSIQRIRSGHSGCLCGLFGVNFMFGAQYAFGVLNLTTWLLSKTKIGNAPRVPRVL